jgi:hypothetical protein
VAVGSGSSLGMFRVIGFKVQGSRFKVKSSRFKVQGSGLKLLLL